MPLFWVIWDNFDVLTQFWGNFGHSCEIIFSARAPQKSFRAECLEQTKANRLDWHLYGGICIGARRHIEFCISANDDSMSASTRKEKIVATNRNSCRNINAYHSILQKCNYRAVSHVALSSLPQTTVNMYAWSVRVWFMKIPQVQMMRNVNDDFSRISIHTFYTHTDAWE